MSRTLLASCVVSGLVVAHTVAAAPTTVAVSAAAFQGVSSGVTIAQGSAVVVTATGTWSVGGPYGTYGGNGTTLVEAPEPCALSQAAPMGALIGSLDSGSTWFPIGAGPTVVPGPGPLLLAANDCLGPGGSFYSDNNGSLTVTITTTLPVSVPANAFEGVDTGVTVAEGLTVVVTATGTWSVGGPYGSYGGDGTTLVATPEPCALSQAAPMGALIGSLNGGSTWFPMGAGPTVVPGSGPLLLAANDCLGPGGAFYSDNSGSLTATLSFDLPQGLPTAEAGANQSIHAGQTVQLDGNGSFDDTTPTQNLQYTWSFASAPAGSAATLSAPHAIKPTFVADLSGTYVVSLVVTDAGGLSSNPDEVTISSLNAPPNAEAGPDQGTFVGNLVQLNGSDSHDPDFDPITFSWTLIASPGGSTVTLNDANTATPAFVPDLPGAYVVDLIANDPFVASSPDTVTIAVTTTVDFAGQQTVDAINTAGSLPPSSVTTKGNQTALGNLLTQVIAALQVGDVGEAKKKLQDAIERTDGCHLRGSPDSPGGGHIKQDYIKTCTDQAPVYTLLKDALDSLSGGL